MTNCTIPKESGINSKNVILLCKFLFTLLVICLFAMEHPFRTVKVILEKFTCLQSILCRVVATEVSNIDHRPSFWHSYIAIIIQLQWCPVSILWWFTHKVVKNTTCLDHLCNIVLMQLNLSVEDPHMLCQYSKAVLHNVTSPAQPEVKYCLVLG